MNKSSNTQKKKVGNRKAGTRNSKNQQQQNKQRTPVVPGRMSTAPVAQGRTQTMRKPQMESTQNGNCRIKHREYISDLTAEGSSPSLFKVSGFAINPGLPSLFPWLSQIAPRFEKYRFDKLRFDYETEAPTALGGSIILTVDYDASDAPPSSKVQAMAYKNAVRSPPWDQACHVSAKEDLSQQKQYFIRDGPVPANADVKLYDVGNLFACSQNIATGGATLGELYVEYDCLLMTPQLQGPSDASVDAYLISSNGGTTLLLPLGNNPSSQSSLKPAITINEATGVCTFTRGGDFLFTFAGIGTALTSYNYSGSLGAKLTAVTNPVLGDELIDTGLEIYGVDIGDTFKVVAVGTAITSLQIWIGPWAHYT